MLGFSQLKKGVKIVIDGLPYEILQISHLSKGRGQAFLQAKLKNLINNAIISKTFHPSDEFEEAQIEKFEAKFLYSHRGKYVFLKIENKKEKFELKEEILGKKALFLKENQKVEAQVFQGKIIDIVLPIKIQLKVVQAPPGLKGERKEPGFKQVILETGAKINVPLFIKEGDIIEINTQTGEYLRRIRE